MICLRKFCFISFMSILWYFMANGKPVKPWKEARHFWNLLLIELRHKDCSFQSIPCSVRQLQLILSTSRIGCHSRNIVSRNEALHWLMVIHYLIPQRPARLFKICQRIAATCTPSVHRNWVYGQKWWNALTRWESSLNSWIMCENKKCLKSPPRYVSDIYIYNVYI